jgi:hypothetical protein
MCLSEYLCPGRETLETGKTGSVYVKELSVLFRGKPVYTFERVLLLHRGTNIQQLSDKSLLLICPSGDLLHFPGTFMKNLLSESLEKKQYQLDKSSQPMLLPTELGSTAC